MVPEPNKLCIIVYLDDTRAAVNMVKDLPGIFAGSRCSFVPTQTVAGVLPVTQARLAMSTLNGQLIMSAKWISDMEDYNLREIFNKCYDAASSYGQIRCLCLTAHDAGGADLRLEFHKLSSVSEMLRSFGIGQVHALTVGYITTSCRREADIDHSLRLVALWPSTLRKGHSHIHPWTVLPSSPSMHRSDVQLLDPIPSVPVTRDRFPDPQTTAIRAILHISMRTGPFSLSHLV